MKKLLMILCALLSAAVLCATPFLCAHSNLLPEISTAYYEQKAQEEALNTTGPEAELMRLLLGGSAAPTAEAEPTKPAFTWYGLVLALGGVMALVVMYVLFRKQPDLHHALFWASMLAVPFAFIGARLVYCAVNITFYVKDIAAPEAMLRIWEGGLSLSGALAFIALAGVIGARISKAPAGQVLHALVPAMFILVIAAAVAARTIRMGYGPEIAEGFLSVDLNGTPRLDTAWLVTVAVSLVMLISTLWMQKKALPAASRFALYAFLYGTVMILLESLRKDGHMVWGFVHAEMVFDLIFALTALLYLARTKKRILISLLATAVLAGAVVALEFALDRASIGDGLLYVAYVCVITAYLWWGCSCTKKVSGV